MESIFLREDTRKNHQCGQPLGVAQLPVLISGLNQHRGVTSQIALGRYTLHSCGSVMFVYQRLTNRLQLRYRCQLIFHGCLFGKNTFLTGLNRRVYGQVCIICICLHFILKIIKVYLIWKIFSIKAEFSLKVRLN